MNNTDFLATNVSNQSTLSPNEVLMWSQTAFNGSPPPPMKQEPERWSPVDVAQEQGKLKLVSHVKAQDERKKRDAQVQQQALAIREAILPLVGKIRGGDGLEVGVPLDAETLPESRDTIRAGIATVGIGERKAVFSELPFEAEDVPKGWEVMNTEDGGWMTFPKDHTKEVVSNEKVGKRFKSLGYPTEKTEGDDRVVRVKDMRGVTVQDVSTNEMDMGAAIRKAIDVAGRIMGKVELTTPEAALKVRAADQRKPQPDNKVDLGHKLGISMFDDMVDNVIRDEHPEGYVSSYTVNDKGGIGEADANRGGEARPYMFNVAGSGWEVDRGYGELIGNALTKAEAAKLVASTPSIPLSEARNNVVEHLKKDVKSVQKDFKGISASGASALSMMKYQGANVAKSFPKSAQLIRKAIKSGSGKDWKAAQLELLDSKWAIQQTPTRALRAVHLLWPTTSLETLKDALSIFQRRSRFAESTI